MSKSSEVLRLLRQAAQESRLLRELCAQRRAELGLKSSFESLEPCERKRGKFSPPIRERGKPVPSNRVRRRKSLSKSI